jgi:poly(beta-D-mannuronate) C5 epimerase
VSSLLPLVSLMVCLWAVSTSAAADPAQARTWYVHQTHPQASDDNPGDADRPLKTINASLPLVRAGDTVLVREGVYREQVIYAAEPWTFQDRTYGPYANGESYGRMINFIAHPDEEVVIKGSDLVEGWRRHDGDIWVKDDWSVNSQQVFVDGEPLQQIAGRMAPLVTRDRHFLGRVGEGLADLRPGSFYVDLDADKLYVWLEDGGDPNRHTMEVSVRPFLFYFLRVDYPRLANFKMRHSNTSAAMNWAAVRFGERNGIAENLDIQWTDYIGLSINGSNHVVQNCVVNHNGNSAMSGSGWGHRILGNVTSHNNYRNWNPAWHAGGVKFTGMWDVVVSDHLAEHNNGPGIWFDIWLAHVTVQNSIARDNQGHGIFYEISERAIIRNNLTYRNVGRGIYIANSAHCAVLHNVAYANGMSGIVVHGAQRRSGVYGDPDNRWIPASHNEVRGNILMDNAHPDRRPRGWEDRAEFILPDPADPSNRGNVSDGNVFWRSDDRPILFWYGWGAQAFDFDAWRRDVGHDRGSMIADPRFLDPENGDFRLADDSPAIATVRPHMAVHYDMTGQMRDRIVLANLFTAGPFEVSPELAERVREGRDQSFWWIEADMTRDEWWERHAGQRLATPASSAAGRARTTRPRGAAPSPARATPATETSIDSRFRPLDVRGHRGEAPLEVETIRIANLLRQQARGQGPVRLVSETPFRVTPASTIALSPEHRRAEVVLHRTVTELQVLHALVEPDPAAPVQLRCVIVRDDGTEETLEWTLGENAQPVAVGGELTQPAGENHHTSIATLADDTSLMVTRWENRNEWFPISSLRFELPEDAASRVLILGVSVAGNP